MLNEVITENPYSVNLIYGKTVKEENAIDLEPLGCEGKT
jgi:hypothetical protein